MPTMTDRKRFDVQSNINKKPEHWKRCALVSVAETRCKDFYLDGSLTGKPWETLQAI